jgi:hypothetical protein
MNVWGYRVWIEGRGFSRLGGNCTHERPRSHVVHETVHLVRDMNGDGLPDVINEEGVTLSPYSPTGLLARLERGPGASTEITYTSSAWSEPAGTPSAESELASHKPMVTEIIVDDPVSLQSSREVRTYSGGRMVDGILHGFVEVTSHTWFHDPRVSAAYPLMEWLERAEVAQVFELDRDWTVEFERTIRGSRSADWAIDPGGWSWTPDLLAHVETFYESFGLAPVMWAREIMEYADDGGSEVRTVRVERDANGLVMEASRLPGDRFTLADEGITVTTEYTSNGVAWWLPSRVTTWSPDPAGGSAIAVEELEYWYDDAGAAEAERNVSRK